MAEEKENVDQSTDVSAEASAKAEEAAPVEAAEKPA